MNNFWHINKLGLGRDHCNNSSIRFSKKCLFPIQLTLVHSNIPLRRQPFFQLIEGDVLSIDP
jgi:hypothetical protein